MGKIKDEIQELFDTCERKYQRGGYAAVIDYIEEAKRQGDNMIMLEVQYERCDACDNDMPSHNHICLVCGQSTKPTKQTLVDAVIEDLKNSFISGDYTVLDELLNMLPTKNLVQALPEERWKEFEELNKDYFNVTHTGFEPAAQREEVRIHAGENGNIVIYQDGDQLGFIVDVYGQDDIVGTMTVWEEDLANEEDEEEPIFTTEEIDDFVETWGQKHNDICAALGYSRKESDDLLMVDYFWLESEKKWFPICASTYNDREQKLADFLRHKS